MATTTMGNQTSGTKNNRTMYWILGAVGIAIVLLLAFTAMNDRNNVNSTTRESSIMTNPNNSPGNPGSAPAGDSEVSGATQNSNGSDANTGSSSPSNNPDNRTSDTGSERR